MNNFKLWKYIELSVQIPFWKKLFVIIIKKMFYNKVIIYVVYYKK